MRGLLLFVLVLAGCMKEGDPVTPKGALDDFDVVHLFSVDGCSVYRFYDGNHHYFTTCRGGTIEQHTVSCGKSCVRTTQDQIPTEVRD